MPELLDWILKNEESFRKSRLPSLYSDLSLQRQTNPAGYSFNVAAWQAALSHAALAGQLRPGSSSSSSSSLSATAAVSPSSSILVIQTSDALLNNLSSGQYGRPLGLGAVIDESVRSGKMMPVSSFLTMQQSMYSSRSWVLSPWSALEWGLRTIGLVGDRGWDLGGGRLRAGGQLVMVENLEVVAGEVIKRQEADFGQGLTERVWDRESFAKQFATLHKGKEPVLSPSDMEVLLRFLQRDKQVLSYDDKVVKFKPPPARQPEPISHQDTTIASLKTLISTLTSQCDALSTRVSALTANASIAIKSSNRISALSALRSRKLAERNLKQRTDTLSQLEEVYTKIEQAAGQVEIVRVMEASADVLKGLNKEVGGVDKVEDVIEELKEEMGKVDEVGQVINEPIGAGKQIDEAEIDVELEAMEAEEREKSKTREEERERKEADATRKRLEEIAKVEDLKEGEQKQTTLHETQIFPQATG